MKSRTITMIGAVAAAALAANSAMAATDLGTFVTATGATSSRSDPVSASAHFVDLGGGNLLVTLQNTEPGDTGYVADTLYGVFFSGATITSLVSGNATAGSTIWTYGSSGPAVPNTLAADTSLQDPWVSGTLGGEQGVEGLSGTDKEGLVSTGFTGTLRTDAIANLEHQPLDQSTAVFLLTYSGTISSISGVEFLYNTSLDTADAVPGTVVPEPTTMIAGALLLLPFGASAIRIVRKNRAA